MGKIHETLEEIRKIAGEAYDDIICVCRATMKDNACSCNCKEFFDESLTNSFKE